MWLTKEKSILTSKKYDSGLAFEIDKRDVVKLVQECWKHSFAKVETNRKAVLTRGWDPRTLSYNVLLHKEIAATKNLSDTSTIVLSSSVDPSTLNTQDGLSGTLIERICLKYNEEANMNGASATERKRKHHNVAENQLELHRKQVSSGLLVDSGQYQTDETVHGYV